MPFETKEKAVGEVIFIISLLGGLLMPFLIMGLTGGGFAWMKTMGIIGLVVIGAEIWSKVKDDKTISQKFWRWSAATKDGKYINRGKAIIILVALQLGWTSLLVHLGWKIMTGSEYPV